MTPNSVGTRRRESNSLSQKKENAGYEFHAMTSGKSLNSLFRNGGLSPLDESGQISPNAIGDTKQYFQSRISESAFDQADHGLGDAGPLRNDVT